MIRAKYTSIILMKLDNFDTLYNCVYNADFWKKCGFRNKRCSKGIEEDEKTYLEEYIKDIADGIVDKRKSVSSYMKRVYKDDIEEVNKKDENEVAPVIIQERYIKKVQEVKEKAKDEFSRERMKWVDEVELTPSVIKEDVKRELHDGISLKSVTTTDFSDIEECHIKAVKDICNKYPNESCSIEILQYLKTVGF
ncbi:hypothetical protein K439DRAFT_1665336 [Ramaria rubella]|nr:hypothetical protein K439DRAFT_1665336 [Ramaria rubella]